MDTFQNVPIDVARLIIEIAALSDSSLCTARALSCVSSAVQLWSDPFLFQNIVIRHEGAVPDAMFPRAYVKTFSTKQETDQEDTIPRFISLCSALQSLCLWSLEPDPSYFSTSVPSPRKMSLSFFDDSLTFRMPLFQSVTHLELASFTPDERQIMWDADISSLPYLTHLVLDVRDEVDDMVSTISNLSSHVSPNLKVLLLILSRYQKDSLNGISYHDKIVLDVGANLEHPFHTVDDEVGDDFVDVFHLGWRAWTGQMLEEETFWGRAEASLKHKRKNT
ncbi:hypothetical protein DL96DRAFT_1631411 [Flagelloscypha sp. PMI_526]|nr:hypothetical protein DL96DRAFT_1631411 [Flagelloscypha sp. PMI_526]